MTDMAYDYDRFEHDDRGGSFLMGLLAGTILGAGLGMLFAPRTGSELRHQLTDSGKRLQRTATEKYHEASDRMTTMVSKGRETLDQFKARSREALEKGREAYVETREAAVGATGAAGASLSAAAPTGRPS